MLVEFGCKRLIVDTGYYECLHQPNVDISKDPILEINETGIVTKNRMYIVFLIGNYLSCFLSIDGQQNFDVIVLATGFLPVGPCVFYRVTPLIDSRTAERSVIPGKG